MSSMAKSTVKMSAMSALKGKVMEQVADENTKLGGFVKKGTAVAEKTVTRAVNKIVDSEVSELICQCIKDSRPTLMLWLCACALVQW